MKVIPLRQFDKFTSAQVITAIIKDGGERGLNIDALRRRLRVLDAVEKLPPDAEVLELEDADYAVLSGAVSVFSFAHLDRNFVTVADDIEAAGASATFAAPFPPETGRIA